MSVRKKILIKNYTDTRKESVAAEAITPGSLVELNSDGAYIKQDVATATKVARLFVHENAWEGEEIDVDIKSGARIVVAHVRPGDEVNALIKDGQTIVIGDKLTPTGDGTLSKLAEPAAVTQTQDDLGDSSGGTPASTVVAITDTSSDQSVPINNNFASITAELAKVKIDLANVLAFVQAGEAVAFAKEAVSPSGADGRCLIETM